jgi:mRNA-degrading endonuclease RelE of RelBE toxin-antitoxin system
MRYRIEISQKARDELRALPKEQERLEDLRDLEQAITENAGQPLIPWDQAKTELELD